MSLLDAAIEDAVEELAKRLTRENLQLITAESCTGGLLAAQLTHLPGSSNWFKGGYIPYTLQTKTSMLNISPDLLARNGAVSEATAISMANEALERGDADISVAVTGIAGPASDESNTAPGTVWLAWQSREPAFCEATCYQFPGDRAAVRRAAVEQALSGLLRYLTERQSMLPVE